ncbi:MAG: glucose 1-dehydrogenase [Deltaproteobacteria bacterium]|jgi:NAD(P)-dependent dehydrogenase (short-subunit alcohol dehydrogenase family)|nr:glucose 1-dehydrogenase [Deltaproteobacteria bacterium]
MSGTAIVVGVGAETGVGGALCRRIGREGLHVLVGGRTAEKIEKVAAGVRSAGGEATPVVMDTTRREDVERIFDAAEEAGSVPELVVYNAGNNQFSPLLQMSDAFFEDLWRLCCFGGFLTGREAAKRMVPAGGGSVLFTGATASLRARPPFTAFASAKAALRALAHGMAREFGPAGLHVGHVVIDGVIDGDMVNTRMPVIKERLGADGMLQVDEIADAFWMLHGQPRSTWTLELDLRPFKESF